MKSKSTAAQKTKIQLYIKQIGLWNEALGFVFLVLAAAVAVLYAGTAQNALFGAFLNLFSFAASFEIALWLAVGVLYLALGWYVRQSHRTHTTAALIGTIVLSIGAILNLLPLIPLILSILVLAKANKQGLSLDEVRKTRKAKQAFNLKQYPDLMSGLGLTAIALIALAVTNIHSASSNDSTYKFPKTQYATCDPTSPAGQCVVSSVEDGFQAVFPTKPTVYTDKNAHTNPTNPSMPSQGVRRTEYSYIQAGTPGSKVQSTTYRVDVIDFKQPIDSSLAASEQQSYEQGRLENGPDPTSQLCNSPDSNSLNGTGDADRTATTYQGLPALSVTMTGIFYKDEKCSYNSLSILKANNLYTVSYTTLPQSNTAGAFDQFMQGFRFTQ